MRSLLIKQATSVDFMKTLQKTWSSDEDMRDKNTFTENLQISAIFTTKRQRMLLLRLIFVWIKTIKLIQFK